MRSSTKIEEFVGDPEVTQPILFRWIAPAPKVRVLPGYLIGRLIVVPIIARRGISVGVEGVVIHKIVGSPRSIVWSDIEEVAVRRTRAQGSQLVLVLGTGEAVVLPAPTSKTRDDVGAARQLILAQLAMSRALTISQGE